MGISAEAIGIDAGLIFAAGPVEVVLGVNAENRSLEDIAEPLSKTDAQPQTS